MAFAIQLRNFRKTITDMSTHCMQPSGHRIRMSMCDKCSLWRLIIPPPPWAHNLIKNWNNEHISGGGGVVPDPNLKTKHVTIGISFASRLILPKCYVDGTCEPSMCFTTLHIWVWTITRPTCGKNKPACFVFRTGRLREHATHAELINVNATPQWFETKSYVVVNLLVSVQPCLTHSVVRKSSGKLFGDHVRFPRRKVCKICHVSVRCCADLEWNYH